MSTITQPPFAPTTTAAAVEPFHGSDLSASVVYSLLASIENIANPVDKAVAAGALLSVVGAAQEDLREIRQDAVMALRDERHLTFTAIASILGVSKGRACQIYTNNRPPRRPGVIEVNARIAAAGLRGKGATNAQVATKLVSDIVGARGGRKVSAGNLARFLDVEIDLVEAHMDAE